MYFMMKAMLTWAETQVKNQQQHNSNSDYVVALVGLIAALRDVIRYH